MEGRGEVGVEVNIGWGTLQYPTLPHGVQVGYSAVQEIKCVCVGGGGVRVDIGWGTLL